MLAPCCYQFWESRPLRFIFDFEPWSWSTIHNAKLKVNKECEPGGHPKFWCHIPDLCWWWWLVRLNEDVFWYRIILQMTRWRKELSRMLNAVGHCFEWSQITGKQKQENTDWELTCAMSSTLEGFWKVKKFSRLNFCDLLCSDMRYNSQLTHKLITQFVVSLWNWNQSKQIRKTKPYLSTMSYPLTMQRYASQEY